MLSFSKIFIPITTRNHLCVFNHCINMSRNIGSYFSSKSRDDSDNRDEPRHDYYANMPLQEKRKHYKCGDHFLELDDIPLWPCLYKVNQMSIKKAIERQRKKLAEKTFKFKEDGDIPKNCLPVRTDLNMKVSLWQGDITKLEIGAIVNAANESLLGGGGVDGSIHRAAGPTLVKECRPLNGCMTGQAKITYGHKLPAKYVIHTVGPRGKNPEKLTQCYENCLRIALEKDIKTIAFCCISTGVFGYPNRDAAHMALIAARKWLEMHGENFERIIFCTYLSQDFEIYQELMADKYFPCDESGEKASDPAVDRRDSRNEKFPVETDERVVKKQQRNTPSESDDTPPTESNSKVTVASENDETSNVQGNQPVETDDCPSMDVRVEPGKVFEKESNTLCEEKAESDVLTLEGPIESSDVTDGELQDAMDLASQQTFESMDMGSQPNPQL